MHAGLLVADVADGLTPLSRRLLWELPRAQGEPEAGEPFGAKGTAVLSRALGVEHPPSVDAVLTGQRAAGSDEERRVAAAWFALVRLSWPWALRYPLVVGQGNLGSADDPPADHFYAECRRSAFADAALDGETGVSRLPLILVNGYGDPDEGVLPPHRLGAVVDATLALMADPDLSNHALMAALGAPDFPTGGMLLDPSALPELYQRGAARIRLVGRYAVGDYRGRQAVMIHELPWGAAPEAWILDVCDLIAKGQLNGVSDAIDEGEATPLPLVLVLEEGADPIAVLATLRARAGLERNFDAVLEASQRGVRRRFDLRGLLGAWLTLRRAALVELRTSPEEADARIERELTDLRDRFDDDPRTEVVG